MDTALKERLRDVRKSLPQKTSQEAFAKLLALHEIQYRRALAAHRRGRDV